MTRENLAPVSAALNQYFAALPKTVESRRIFHGRGKYFEYLDWLTVDVHPGFLLLTVFKSSSDSAPQNLDVEVDIRAVSDLVVQTLSGFAGPSKFAVVLQRRDLSGAPFSVEVGSLPSDPVAVRAGAKYQLTFSQQNIGYFLDIEPARLWLEKYAQSAHILNLFSYTCTFSVVAMMAGADSVINFDLSRKSLERGRINHSINDALTPHVRFFPHDILKSWGKIRKFGPYDIIVIDPPSFQKGSFIAKKDYRKVLVKMNELLSEDGKFLACLNAPEIEETEFKSWVEEACPEFSCDSALSTHPDFPERDEGRGLKMLAFSRTSKK